MIGRLARSKIVKAIGLMGAAAVAYLSREEEVIPVPDSDSNRGVPAKFSLYEPEDAVPVLDKDGNVHEIGFLFPTPEHKEVVIRTTEPVIRCRDNTNKFSHKILNYTETGLPSTISCIQVHEEISVFGSDAFIREEAKFHQRDTNKPKPPAKFRVAMLNTEGKEGICTPQACLPSVHVMDFDFLPSSVTVQNATKWGGTIEEVKETMDMAARDLTRAEQACQKLEEQGKSKHTAEECKRRANIAVRQFAYSVSKLVDQTAADKTRVLSENSHTLFGSAANIPDLEKQPMVAASSRRNNL